MLVNGKKSENIQVEVADSEILRLAALIIRRRAKNEAWYAKLEKYLEELNS